MLKNIDTPTVLLNISFSLSSLSSLVQVAFWRMRCSTKSVVLVFIPDNSLLHKMSTYTRYELHFGGVTRILSLSLRARHVKFFENFRFYILQKIWKQILHFTRACKKVGFYILQITRVCKNQFLQITFYRILQDFARFYKRITATLLYFTFYKKNAI